MNIESIFPEKFKALEPLGKANFLKTANLTKGEKNRLSVFLEDIQVLYKIPFQDGSQMRVLWSSCSWPESNHPHFLRNYATAIVQAFSDPCMLLVKNKNYLKICLFEKKPNSKDENRSVVLNAYSSPFMDNRDRIIFLSRFFDECTELIECSNQADELNQSWIRLLCKERFIGGELGISDYH